MRIPGLRRPEVRTSWAWIGYRFQWYHADEGPHTVPVGQASETELARPITPLISREVAVGQAVEVESANGIDPQISRREVLIGQATEVELARLISPVKPIFVPVQTAVERELARLITAQKGEPFLPVVECAVTALAVTGQVTSLPVACEIVDGYGQNH